MDKVSLSKVRQLYTSIMCVCVCARARMCVCVCVCVTTNNLFYLC